MACEPSYTDCMRRRPESGIGAELVLHQLVRRAIGACPLFRQKWATCLTRIMLGGFKFQVQRVNDDATV